MAASGGQDQVRSHVEDKLSDKQGLFYKLKDGLNFTKHLGFVSDLDSPANQAALAAMREKEEREGVEEEIPQAPLSERIMQGISNVADIASAATVCASGGVAPRGEGSPEHAESEREAVPGLGHPELVVSGTGDKGQELSNGPTPKNSEQQHKHSLAHRPGQIEQDSQAAEKEGHSFSRWALRAAHKLGDAVASKDLTDGSSKKT